MKGSQVESFQARLIGIIKNNTWKFNPLLVSLHAGEILPQSQSAEGEIQQ